MFYTERSEIADLEVNKEKLDTFKPVIIVSVTLGKELHAGHSLLLAVADILRLNLQSSEPLFLVNNNTGPRAAGALVTLAEGLGVDVTEAANLANQGTLPIEVLVASYRQREEISQEKIKAAMEILAGNDIDIFSAIANKTQVNLDAAGFSIKVVPESKLSRDGDKIIEAANPTWAGSGFIPVFTGSSLKILKRGGFLTASGVQVANLASLSKEAVANGQKPFFIFVDSSIDTKDAVSAFSQLPNLGKATSVFGAGFGLNGDMASGTGGQAITLEKLMAEFKKMCPGGSVARALRHLILTCPVVVKDRKVPDPRGSFYDFKSNEAFVKTLVASHHDSVAFRGEIEALFGRLEAKVGNNSFASHPKAPKWFEFLEVRTKAIAGDRESDILGGINQFARLKSEEDIAAAVKKQGYAGKEAEERTKFYLKGPQALCMRGGYFRGKLRGIIGAEQSIVSLSPQDFAMIKSTVKLCLSRLGYEN